MFLRSDGSWAEVVTASIDSDNVTLKNNDGVLSIVGFEDAQAGAHPVKNQDGQLEWVKPDTTAVDNLQTEVNDIKTTLDSKAEISDVEEALELKANKTDVEEALNLKANATDVEEALQLKANKADVEESLELKANKTEVEKALNLKADASNVYTKKEADSAIAAAIADVEHLKREIVNVLPDIEDANPNTIYMTPSGLQEDDNKYYEWILINDVFEQVGSWEVDLKAYAKAADVEAALDEKVDKEANSRLITEVEASKLANINDGAEKNIINSVSTDFEIVSDDSSDRKLVLKSLPISKVVDLENQLNNKVSKKEGWTLLSPEDQIKLGKLSIDDSGEVGISGTVSAANVQELYGAVVDIVTGTGTGIYDKELKPLLGIETGAEKNYINSVNDLQLTVENRQLSIKAIDMNIVTGLESALNSKASSKDVVDVQDLLNTRYQNHEARIANLEGQLTWQYLEDNII